MKKILTYRAILIAFSLTLTVLFTAPKSERYGDNLQIALPLAALGCKVITGGAGEYFMRFLAMNTVLHSSKIGLGDHPLNVRPHGGLKGFPSGHTAAATFGASSLVHDCLSNSPVVKATIVIAAAFVGTSRVAAEAHTIWQVLAGALLALVFERGFRGLFGWGKRYFRTFFSRSNSQMKTLTKL